METESSWFELAGIIFFTWMVIIVGLLWGLSIKASYNEEKEKTNTGKTRWKIKKVRLLTTLLSF